MGKLKLKREALPDRCPDCGAFIPMQRYYGSGFISVEVNKHGFLENWGDLIFEEVGLHAECPNCGGKVSPDRDINSEDLERGE